LKKFLKDIFNNLWVFVGLFIAWLVTYKIRKYEEKDPAK